MFGFLGCDRKKYHDRRNKLDDSHRLKVETLIKKWEEAEKRYNALKSSDGDQAASSMTGEYTVVGKWMKENRVVEDDFDGEGGGGGGWQHGSACMRLGGHAMAFVAILALHALLLWCVRVYFSHNLKCRGLAM